MKNTSVITFIFSFFLLLAFHSYGQSQSVYGYSIIIWDDAAPQRVSGLAGTQIGYSEYYDAWVFSCLWRPITEQCMSSGDVYGYPYADGYHPTFYALSNQTYCVDSQHGLADFFNNYYYFSTGVCHTFPTPPPTPTPTATPECDPLNGASLAPCEPTPTPVPLPTPNVISVVFSQVQSSTEPISGNPVVSPHNPGIGRRIFPDDDTPQDGVDRRLVRVTATLSQPIPNVPVYFRNFDLDDPASDTTIDPNGNVGDDNNGTPMAGTLSMCTATSNGCSASTNASGVAIIEFTVTRQPGDNFAIAAGVTPAEVGDVTMSGIELMNGGGQTIPTNCPTQLVCRSEMLTVWRRLHIEVDSMGVSDGNFVLGTTPIARPITINPGQSWILGVIPSPKAPLEVNRFENGRFVVGTGSLFVQSNNGDNVTVINQGSSSVTIQGGVQFQLYDDDDFDNLDGVLVDGDNGEDIPMLPPTYLHNADDTALNRLASAYIRPIYDIGDNNESTIFFPNVAAQTTPALMDLYDFDQVLSEAHEDFWTIYLLSAYQADIASDEDPESEYVGSVVGVADGQDDISGVYRGQGVVVFFETNGPKECPASGSQPPLPAEFCNINSTKLHEVGHRMGLDHGEGGVMDDLNTLFTVESIARIRGSDYP